MFYFKRRVVKQVAINKSGRLGFVPFIEFIKVETKQEIEKFNLNKINKFEESDDEKLNSYMLNFCEVACPYEMKEKHYKELSNMKGE